jgi:carboxymethylenebutenolidase
MESKVDIRTADGVMDAYTFSPSGAGPWPGVIFFMDGIGIRQALHDMAARLAGHGYFVIMPNLYYRGGQQAEFNPAEVFKGGPERDRLMGLMGALNGPRVMSDVGACLEFLAKSPSVKGSRVGVNGYCMGGRWALLAACTFPERIVASGSFHAGGLATDQPDSPHLLAKDLRAKVYIAVAGIDPYFSDEERGRIKGALEATRANFRLEVYPDVHHGFAVTDTPVYNKDAAERHWTELLKLYGEALG